jgi:hypothetical protein
LLPTDTVKSRRSNRENIALLYSRPLTDQCEQPDNIQTTQRHPTEMWLDPRPWRHRMRLDIGKQAARDCESAATSAKLSE